MRNEEILRKTIEKAVENEWKKPISIYDKNPFEEKSQIADKDYMRLKIYYWIIFSRDFAKAFWGNNLITDTIPVYVSKQDIQHRKYRQVAWQYHLSKMVLKKEPLKYLEKFLEKK